MNKLKLWIKATRIPFLTATLVPVILGAVAAWHDFNVFSWPLFFLALFGAIFVHLGVNLSNDYFDHISGNDEANKTPTMFSGGSRVIQEKLIPAKQILIAAILFFALGTAIGLYLNFILPGNMVIILGAIGIFLGLFYTAPPFKIGYNGLGEIITGIGFGPLMVLGSYFVQAQILTLSSFFISIPIAILIALVLFINEFPDYEADKKVRKNTIVVLLGKKFSVNVYIAFLALAYIIVITGAISGLMPYYALIVFFTLPLAYTAIKTLIKNYDKIEDLLPANKAAIALHLVFGLLLTAAYALDAVF
mgnify:CR=1 FL=1